MLSKLPTRLGGWILQGLRRRSRGWRVAVRGLLQAIPAPEMEAFRERYNQVFEWFEKCRLSHHRCPIPRSVSPGAPRSRWCEGGLR